MKLDPKVVVGAMRDGWPAICRAAMDAGTVAIGTWPTPEHPGVDKALDGVALAVLDVLPPVPVPYRERALASLRRAAPDIASHAMRLGTVAIGSWPTPEHPALDRPIRALAEAVIEALPPMGDPPRPV